jgi:hypothetical protein
VPAEENAHQMKLRIANQQALVEALRELKK